MKFPSKEELALELFGISTKIVALTEQIIKEKKLDTFKDMFPALGHTLQAVKALRGEEIEHPFMNLISMPMDYLIELRDKEERKKSRCFVEYIYDLDIGEDNSVRFYSKSWEISVGTAHKWLKEFDDEIIKYDMSKRDI